MKLIVDSIMKEKIRKEKQHEKKIIIIIKM